MQVNKLELTDEELSVLNNSHFFSVKMSVTRKIIDLFGMLEAELKKELHLSPLAPEQDLNIATGKIFRGENYLNLPYIVLDYPKLFNTKNVFAFRSMLWWGNGFSFTLHLQGDSWESRKKKIINNLESLRNQGLYICVNDTPWQYHFEKNNYILLDEFLNQNRREELHQKIFIKISSRLDITEYAEVIPVAKKTLTSLMKLIS